MVACEGDVHFQETCRQLRPSEAGELGSAFCWTALAAHDEACELNFGWKALAPCMTVGGGSAGDQCQDSLLPFDIWLQYLAITVTRVL